MPSMSQQVGKKTPRRAHPNFLNAILMVALTLFILGLTGLIGLHFRELSVLIRENVRVSIFLKDSMSEVEIMQLQKKIETEPYVKSTTFTSKEDARKEFLTGAEEEDFTGILGYNPLPASINIFLVASYSQIDSLGIIKQQLKDKYLIDLKQIKVNEELVSSINTNLGAFSLVMGILALILIIIVVVMIDSTVRLAMYSNRFLVKSMQLVGATRWFITKPYLYRSLINGLISGMLAIVALILVIYVAQQNIIDLYKLQNNLLWIVLFLGLLLLGVGISWISTFRAVTKYLRMKLDELY